MSKVLVDRELLGVIEKTWRIVDCVHTEKGKLAITEGLRRLRAILAQPAEPGGVDVVAWRCEASKPGIKTQVRLLFTWPEAESFALHYEDRGCKVTTTALVEKAKLAPPSPP